MSTEDGHEVIDYDNGGNHDDFSRRPKEFGKENIDRIVFSSEFEKMELNGVSNVGKEATEETNKNSNDRFLFPSELEKISNGDNKGTTEANEEAINKSDDRIVFPNELEKILNGDNNGITEATEETINKSDDRIVFPDDELLNTVDRSTAGSDDKENFENYIRDPSNFGTDKEVGAITIGDGENFEDYIRQPENFGNKEKNDVVEESEEKPVS